MMSETEHVRTPRRELLRSEECPKCGTFPQPTWKREGDIVGEFHQTGASLLEGTFSEKAVEKECLRFDCPCGFSWEMPPRDAGSRHIAGVVVPNGYNLIRDEYAPASPAGFRVVRE